MTAVAMKKALVLAVALLALLAAAAPAMAAEGNQGSGRQVDGKFVLVLDGPLVHEGQTYFVSQRGLRTDPSAPICTTGRSNGLAQSCRVGSNVLPFVGPDGHRLSYRLWARNDRTGEVTPIESGSKYIHNGVVIRTRYGS